MRDDDESPGTPEWIVTFADIMSLLLTFFVFILTFSTIEVMKYKKVAGSLQGALGITPKESLPLNLPSFISNDQPERPRRTRFGPETPPKRNLEDVKEDLESVQRVVLPHDRLFEIEQYPEGVRIRPDEGVFDPSSARLPTRWRSMVLDVADVLLPRRNRVLVEAFTDDRFLATEAEPDPFGMRLDRAVRVAEVLEEGGLGGERIGIRLPAEARYPYPNDTPRNRARNRSFEIVVQKESERE